MGQTIITNNDSSEIANEILHFAKSARTDKKEVAIANLVPRKEKLNAKESNFDLISHFNINPIVLKVMKAPAKRKFYRNYKNFDEDNFNKDLKLKLDPLEEVDYSLFENTFIDVLNTHAPIKAKTLQANSHQFMTKGLRKAIITRSGLKIIYLKSRNEENWVNYKRQRNFCTNLLKKTKQKYFCNLNMKDLNDNKRFW